MEQNDTPLTARFLFRKKLTQQGDSFVYFMNSIKRFDKGKAFLSHLDKVGFVGTRFKKQTFGISSLYIACKR